MLGLARGVKAQKLYSGEDRKALVSRELAA
jgi:hypothetical protein